MNAAVRCGLGLALLLLACRSEPEPEPPRSVRANVHVLRDLTWEAARAELRAGGLTIDLGTPDRHKYVNAISGRLSFYEPAAFDRILLRARAQGDGDAIEVTLDGEMVGRRPLGREWEVIELPLEREVEPGFHTLSHAPLSEVELGWVQMRSGPATEPPSLAKLEVVTFGAPRQALIADPPRALSYYLEIPDGARLVFDYGADGPTELAIELTEDGEQTRRVFSAQSDDGIWREGSVDLAEWAGEIVRLDLVTRGEAARAAWGEPQIVRDGPAPDGAPPPLEGPPRNVVVIVIDTARQDAFAAFNPETKVRTPRFSALAEESTIFTRAYSTAPWTKPSVATLLSGLHPSTHGAVSDESKLPEEITLLSEHLQERGFATAMFSANGYVSDRFGFDQGWDRYVNFIRARKATDAEDVYERAIDWVEQRSDEAPFFLYVQTIDPHVPYRAPERYLGMYFDGSYEGRLGADVTGYEQADFNDGKLRLSDQDRDYVIAQYFGEISYHDHHLGRFVDRLRELGHLDSTLLVVTNDHGEELFDRRLLGHGHTLHDELVRSPLLMRAPGTFPSGRRVKEPVSLVDVAPTILEALEVDPLPEAEGMSILGRVYGRPALVPAYALSERRTIERAVRLRSHGLIASEEGERVFDLIADPRERTDIAAERPIVRRALQIHLYEGMAVPKQSERLLGAGPVRRYRAQEAMIDPELREHLEALGYLND